MTAFILGAFLGYFIPLMVARFSDAYIERHVAEALDLTADLDEAATLADIDWPGGAR